MRKTFVLPGTIVLLVILGFIVSGADKTEVPIEDGFKNPKLWKFGTKAWTLENGILKQTANQSTTSALFLPTQYKKWDGYVVTVKVKPGEEEKGFKGGYLGVKVKGVYYVIRKDGLWAVYPREKQKMGGTFHKQASVPGKWYEIRIVTKDKKILGYLDGKPWLALPEVPDPDEVIHLICCHFSGEFTDFKVIPLWENEAQELAGISSAVNRFGNSSFETVIEDLPAGWRQATYIHKWSDEKDYFDSLTVSEIGAYDGKKCIYLETKDDKFPAGFISVDHINVFNKTVTISVFLKADHENAKVEIGTSYEKKEFQVGTKWQRYVITTTVPRPAINVRIVLKSKGKLWVDAIQLEVDDKVTPYQAGPKYKNKTSSVVFKSKSVKKTYPVTMIDDPIKIDGHLDEKSWHSAKPIEMNLIKTLKPPKEVVYGKILCDNHNLYVGYRCQISTDRKIPTDEATRLKNPWAIDNVEFLVDPSGQCKSVLQMATNLSGSKGGGRGRLGTANFASWAGEWTSAGSRENDFYSIEMKVPLAILYLDENTPKRWLINLARTNPETREFICSSPCLHSFHEPENYDEIQLPDTLDLKPFALRLMDLKLLESGKSGYFNLSGKVFNGTDMPEKLTLEFTTADQNKPFIKTVETDQDQLVSFHIEGIKVNQNKKQLKFTVHIKNQKNKVVRICEKTVKIQPTFSVFPEYSYFSNEKIARIFAERGFISNRDTSINAKAVLLKDSREIKSVTITSKEKILIFPFKISDLIPGEYSVRVTIGNGQLPSKQCPFIIRKYQKGETKIDHLRRCAVINGKSSLVFLPGVMTYVDLTDDFWKLFAAKEMTTVMIWPGRPHVNMLGTYLDSAKKYGINLFFHIMPRKDLIDRPNLLGWLVVDEPAGKKQIQKTINAVDNARKIDPHHIIYCNHMPPQMASNYAGLPGNIVSIDYYPLVAEGRSIWEIGALTRKMEELATPRRIPSWFFVQGNYLAREPTARELSAQTYMVLVNGGTGISYFFGLPHGKRAWKRFVEINKEMLALNDILLSVEDRPLFSQQCPDDISATSRCLEGVVYLIAVNGRRKTVNEKFRFPGIESGSAEVMFENRTVKVKDGRINDTFKPLQRHVYKIISAKE